MQEHLSARYVAFAQELVDSNVAGLWSCPVQQHGHRCWPPAFARA